MARTHLVILLAERWCTMHDAGTSVRGDEIAGDHLEAARLAVGLKISDYNKVNLGDLIESVHATLLGQFVRPWEPQGKICYPEAE